jgi:hypothetical protein
VNDVLMFKRSGLSIAMGNASEEVQRQAMCVTTSSADEGFANAVDKYIPPRAKPATGAAVKAIGQLHRLGQSIWLDNITRDLLTSGTLERYVNELSVTGLTSNPTIFENAIKNSTAYDTAIGKSVARDDRPKNCFLSLPSTISPAPQTCSDRFTTRPMAWTDGCRWKCRLCLPTTQPGRSPQPKTSSRGQADPT